jgi:hypothetical protein
MISLLRSEIMRHVLLSALAAVQNLHGARNGRENVVISDPSSAE